MALLLLYQLNTLLVNNLDNHNVNVHDKMKKTLRTFKKSLIIYELNSKIIGSPFLLQVIFGTNT